MLQHTELKDELQRLIVDVDDFAITYLGLP